MVHVTCSEIGMVVSLCSLESISLINYVGRNLQALPHKAWLSLGRLTEGARLTSECWRFVFVVLINSTFFFQGKVKPSHFEGALIWLQGQTEVLCHLKGLNCVLRDEEGGGKKPI